MRASRPTAVACTSSAAAPAQLVYPQLIADLLQRQVVVPAPGRVRRARRLRAGRGRPRPDARSRTSSREWAPPDGQLLDPDPAVDATAVRERRTAICPNALIPNQETDVIRTAFNDDWRVRPKVNALHGAGRRRRPAVGGGATAPRRDDRWDARPERCTARNGYFPGGVWEYQKTFVVPETDRGKRILVEFEGVYRGARRCT